MWKAFNRKHIGYAGVLVATGAASYHLYNENTLKKRRLQPYRQHLATISPDLFMSETHSDALNKVQLEGLSDKPHTLWTPPSRKELVNMLKGHNKDGSPSKVSTEPPFDILIIGGGATGAGAALDAATRGLKVALVERDDFSSGTSSRSTKLVHGGVRYLEKAVKELDYGQYKLVKEALHERFTFLQIAPYLSYQLPIMLPIYKWWQIPYFWFGSKCYDKLAGREAIESSYFLTRGKALEAFPWLNKDKLVGAMVYYDGQHNDARMNVAIALTAISLGAVVVNHVEATRLIKNEDGEVSGACVKDTLTGEEWTINSKGVINATGAFTDSIRSMDNYKNDNIVAPSSGVHVILPNYYSPRKMGLLDPSTSDGRVIFFLPWEGNTIAGTTDSPTELTYDPMPKEEEIQWILDEIRRYLSPDIKVRRGDVLAAWSGIRPLVRDPSAKNTAGLVRSHIIHVSDSNLITVAGGKWTTYRAMAKDAIDKAIDVFELKPLNECLTETAKLVGSHGYSKTMFIKLIQQFGLETETAQHLSNSYGDRAWAVAALSKPTGKRWPVFGQRLSPFYPYIEAEVRYAVRREYACTLVDVIARRTRLAFLNAQAALESLPYIIEIMSEELGWSPEKQTQEFDKTVEFLFTMGLPHPKEKLTINKVQIESAKRSEHEDIYSRSQFQPEELASFQKVFAELDVSGDGRIKTTNIEKALTFVGYSVPGNMLNYIMTDAKLDKSDSIEFEEFLEIMSGVKELQLKNALSKIVDRQPDKHEQKRIPIERSSGGV
ncbi:3089_t:CDS:2 [Funneliformis geosporum]|uniref:Glycerol-3-phosphate dehydrogenase n=1 Tax=Funneliformis geosporum TaxID=1117311 RepID=A0A9W4WR75_9GLOM|nr:3089_t:CDS:2 [Funneliformis geosporum]CAI2166051.1 11622_t:CDS:2 [Funneliformis geosporum]